MGDEYECGCTVTSLKFPLWLVPLADSERPTWSQIVERERQYGVITRAYGEILGKGPEPFNSCILQHQSPQTTDVYET